MLRSPLSLRSYLVLAATLASIALLLTATGVHASQISHNGSVLTYTAAPGEANSPLVSVNEYEILCDPLPAPCLTIWDPGLTISFPAGWCAGSRDDIRCAMPDRVVANLGDREDSYWDWDGDSTVDAGPGNDNPINGNGGNDTLRGGSGVDVLIGQLGNDALDGGPGDDFLEGFSFPGEAESLGSDTYVSGGGADALTYGGRGDDLVLSLDGAANDGAPGEADDIGPDMAVVSGGSGADTLIGNSAGNVLQGGDGDDLIGGGGGDDRLSGGRGNDHLSGDDGQDALGGDAGDDVLDGGPDIDGFWGDGLGACIPALCATGQDVIFARDGNQEKVKCGPGTDYAAVDAIDYVVHELGISDQCESVEGAGAPGGGPGPGEPGRGTPGSGPSGRRKDEALRIPMRFTAPGAGLVTVRASARNGGKRIAVGSASRRARRRGRVRMVLTVKAETTGALRESGDLRITLKATFRPKGRRPYLLARRTVTVPAR